MAKQLTNKGKKIRYTRRKNQVISVLSYAKISGKDSKNLLELMTQNLTTKKGVARSKRIETLLFKEKNYKKLLRFKEFDNFGNIKVEKITFKTINRLLESDADVYKNLYDEIMDFNKLTKNQKKDRRFKATRELEKKYSNYMQQKEENIF